MKKRVLFVSLLLSMVLAATACGGKKDSSKEEANVQTTESAEQKELASVPTGEEGEVELGDYKGITVEYAEQSEDSATVTDDEVQTKIDSFLEQNKISKEIKDRAVKKGDTVNIDYEGTKDGVKFDGGTAQGYDLEIGSKTFIDGFEDGLIGAKIGETKKLNLTFPEKYSNEDLAGKDVVFEVKINSIRVEKTPELTDKLVAEKTDFKTAEEYKADIKANLLEDKKWKIRLQKWDACWAAALDNAKVKKFSKKDVEDMKQKYIDSSTQYASQYGVELEDYVKNMGMSMDDFQKQADLTAREAVKRNMVRAKIAELENIAVSDEDYNNGVDGIVKLCGWDSKEQLMEQFKEEQLKDEFLTYKVEEFISNNAKIVAPPETEAPAATEDAQTAVSPTVTESGDAQ